MGSRFVVRDGQRWLPNAAMGFVDPRKGACGESFGRCHHDRWKEGMELNILFRIQCVDEVALQAVL